MKKEHAAEREKLAANQKARQDAETRERALRLRTGVRGLWDRITGERHRTLMENEREAFASLKRDADQREALRAAQLNDRRRLQGEIAATRRGHRQKTQELHADLVRLRERQKTQTTLQPERARPTQEFGEAAAKPASEKPAVKSPSDLLEELRRGKSRSAPSRGRDFER